MAKSNIKLELPKQSGEYKVTTEDGTAILTFNRSTERWYFQGLEVGTGLHISVPKPPIKITGIEKMPAAQPGAPIAPADAN